MDPLYREAKESEVIGTWRGRRFDLSTPGDVTKTDNASSLLSVATSGAARRAEGRTRGEMDEAGESERLRNTREFFILSSCVRCARATWLACQRPRAHVVRPHAIAPRAHYVCDQTLYVCNHRWHARGDTHAKWDRRRANDNGDTLSIRSRIIAIII